MKLIPIYTEKTMKLANNGKYTFLVDLSSGKKAIKQSLLEIFGVRAKDVRTVRTRAEFKRNMRGGKVRIPARKKAVITLKEGEKLDIFEEKKK